MLTGRQAGLGLGGPLARRLAPDVGIFAAMVDGSQAAREALGALVASHGDVAVVEGAAPQPVPGTRVTSEAVCWQMVAAALPSAPPATFAWAALGEADGAEMLALATLTRPGPFFLNTHRLGRFIGVREGGRLVAMAGERMAPDGVREVSGVCTHPDYRGRGYAAGLMRQVAARIAREGETPFLHVYASNRGAIALYETLGFIFRRELVMTSLAAA